MDNPRAEKVAVVNEVQDRLQASDGAVLTEYRGLTVAELAELRQELASAGGDYKVYKNTLVRLAVADGPQAAIHDLLTGPTAIAFVQGDVSAVAKALRDFARGNPNLVVKGGMVGSGLLSASDINVLADLPPEGHPAGPVRRGPGRTAPAAGRPGPGPAPQPGLRDLGADRPAPGRRRGAGGPGRAPRPQPRPAEPQPRPPRAATEATSANRGRRGVHGRGCRAPTNRPDAAPATPETE